MRLFTRLGLAALLLPLLAACSTSPAAPDTSTNYDRQFNFSGVRKIYIEPSSRTNAATIMISDAQISRIDSALQDELVRKGFEVVSSSQQAELFLNWYLVPKDQVQDRVSAGDCDGCDMSVVGGARYAKGTLIVDMIDAMRNKPVWRSVLKTEMTAQPGSASAERARQAAAEAIFANFPPQ